MRIDASGNLGIGTNSPQEKLHVSSGAIRISNTSNSLLELNTNAGNRFGYLFGTSSSLQLAAESTANNVLSLSTNNAERMRITSAGGVSFGNTGTAYGTSGQVLTSAGNAPPTWETVSGTISVTGGDLTLSGNTGTAITNATLATVNSNTGSFGSATAVPVITVNGKGLVTAVSTATVAGGQYFGSAAVKAIAYNASNIDENITMTYNGMSVGAITIGSGYSVTVNAGVRWVIL
jgi:hypothetical protein